jgi:hypothetical protein
MPAPSGGQSGPVRQKKAADLRRQSFADIDRDFQRSGDCRKRVGERGFVKVTIVESGDYRRPEFAIRYAVT